MLRGVVSLGPARARRLLVKALEQATRDPREALLDVHRLIDGGFDSPEVAALEARLLITLGCGSFAAHAAQRGLSAGGDRLTFLLLLLEAHLTAFNRKPARQVLDQLLLMAPLPSDAIEAVAHGASELGRHAEAEQLYAERIHGAPSDHRAAVNFAHALLKTGEIDRAESLLDEALTDHPEAGHAWRLLAGTRRQTRERNILSGLRSALPRMAPGSDDLAAAFYALGKTLEDLGELDEAFGAFTSGARITRPRVPYSTAAVEDAFALTKDFFAARPSSAPAEAAGAPLFIVGLPRTGSTLIDRMLTGHDEIVSMGELGCFKEAMKIETGYAGGPGFHEYFYSTSGQRIAPQRLGARYRAAASPEIGAPRWYIDKYHMNFLDLGLIAEALPEARFIHTIRHPLDTIFGNFKQLFTLGFHHFSYDLAECTAYYLLYRDLIAFWHRRLPGRILDVVYEDVVADQAGQARRMLDFLGLDWADACASHHKNPTPVDTASMIQVREPLYARAVGHWQGYRPYLGTTIAELEKAGVSLGGLP